MQRLQFLDGPAALPELIKRDAGLPCFVYFGAKWCPDCDRSSPLVSKAVAASGACKVFWVDVGDKATFRDKTSKVRTACTNVWKLRCLPTLIYVGSDGTGRIVDRLDTELEECEDPAAGLKLASDFIGRCMGSRPTFMQAHLLKTATVVAAVAVIAGVVLARSKT